MTNVFSEQEKASAYKTKKILFWSWFAVLMVVVAAIGAMAGVNLYYVEVYRDRTYATLFAALSGILGVGYACASLFFFAIKYKLTRKYVKMLRDMETGLKDTFEGKFVEYDDKITMKDGVYFYTMVLKTRPLKRGDIDERRLLIEQTIPKLDIIAGTKLKIESHANIMMAYEILETPSIEQSEQFTAAYEEKKKSDAVIKEKEEKAARAKAADYSVAESILSSADEQNSGKEENIN